MNAKERQSQEKWITLVAKTLTSIESINKHAPQDAYWYEDMVSIRNTLNKINSSFVNVLVEQDKRTGIALEVGEDAILVKFSHMDIGLVETLQYAMQGDPIYIERVSPSVAHFYTMRDVFSQEENLGFMKFKPKC